MSTKTNPIDATGTRLAALIEAREELTERLAEIEKEIKDTTQPGTYNTGAYTVNIAYGTRFDKKRFEKDHPVEAYPDYYYDEPTLLTSDIDPELKTAYTVQTAARLTVKPTK